MKQEQKLKEAFSRAAEEETERLERSLSRGERAKAENVYKHHRDSALRLIRKGKGASAKWAVGLTAAAAAVILLLWGLNRSVPDPVTPAADPANSVISLLTGEPLPAETDAPEQTAPPAESPLPELKAQLADFPADQKYPVYTGPGTNYERARQNKAAVSTNDWIQVFGTENGYLMIQYAVTASQYRIGYIDASSLPGNIDAGPLAFASLPAMILRETALTDDPLGEGQPLHTLSAGTEVQWLAVMGGWAYLEWTGNGQPVRGFVPADAVGRKTAP